MEKYETKKYAAAVARLTRHTKITIAGPVLTESCPGPAYMVTFTRNGKRVSTYVNCAIDTKTWRTTMDCDPMMYSGGMLSPEIYMGLLPHDPGPYRVFKRTTKNRKLWQELTRLYRGTVRVFGDLMADLIYVHDL